MNKKCIYICRQNCIYTVYICNLYIYTCTIYTHRYIFIYTTLYVNYITANLEKRYNHAENFIRYCVAAKMYKRPYI